MIFKMKTKTFIIPLTLLICILFLFNSCDLQEANNNPNDPTEVPPSVMLPFNQESFARLSCGTPQVMAGIFMQYYLGVNNHPIQVQQYILDETLYVDWDWNDYYDGPMNNLKIMIDIAEKEKSYYYAGIGKVLLANCLGNITSLWGDVPYKEAFSGSINRSPAFDAQKDIYESIQKLLDDAITDLQTTYTGKKPASDDLIFGGNATKWVQAAYALKARYYMHLSKRAADLDYNPAQKALDAVTTAIKSSDGDMVYRFGYNAAEYNPFYSFTLLEYILPNTTLTNKMLMSNDPRRSFYYKKKFGVATLNGLYFTSSSSPVFLMTYHELKFIEAEARIRLNPSDPAAQAALQEGVRASIKKITGTATTDAAINSFINANAVLNGNFENDLSVIIGQKYIAMFTSIESWTDYRRTGFPVLTPNEGGDHNQNPGGAIPRRLAYPHNERIYNSNFPETVPNLQDRFWWDK
jgi:hypothetical protein